MSCKMKSCFGIAVAYLMLSIVNGEACTQIKDCNTCEKLSPKCNMCEPHYGLSPDGSCHACATAGSKTANCDSCTAKDDGTIVCETCIPQHGLKGDKSGCTSCASIASCAECVDKNNDGKPECTKCDLGKQPTKDGTACVDCPFAKCASCEIDDKGVATKCSGCPSGFVLNDDATACEECSTKTDDCAKCQQTDGGVSCVECKDGFALSEDGKTCLKCTDVDVSCIKCQDTDADLDADKCTACAKGKLLKDGKCTDCSKEMANCDECSSSTVCSKCQSGYGLKPNGKGCFACGDTADNCVSCQERGYSCSDCKEGLEPTDDGSKCAQFCHRCFNTTHCAHHVSADSSVQRCQVMPGFACWTIRYQFGSEYDYVRDCMPRSCTSTTKQEKCHDSALYRTCEQCCVGNKCNHYLLKDSASAKGAQLLTIFVCLAFAVSR